jgi:hypothetical protein
MGIVDLIAGLGISFADAMVFISNTLTGTENRRMYGEQKEQFDELERKIEEQFGRLDRLSTEELRPLIEDLRQESRERGEGAMERFDAAFGDIGPAYEEARERSLKESDIIETYQRQQFGHGGERLAGMVDYAGKRLTDYEAESAGIISEAEQRRRTAETTGAGIISEAEQRRQEGLAGGREMIGELEGRYARGMGYLEGAGEQQQEDLEREWRNRQAAAEAGLAASGLGGSTIMASMGAGYGREYGAEQRRLEEDLRREQLGWDYAYSADIANERARQQTMAANLYGDYINTMTGQQGVGMAASGDVINTMAGQQAVGIGLGADYLTTLGMPYGGETDISQRLIGARLGYGDEQWNRMFGAESALGMAPIAFEAGIAGQKIDYYGQPQQIQPWWNQSFMRYE